jgi:hypothetical protein
MISLPSLDREAAEAEAFREQCRRQMARPMALRMKYGFCRVHRPVLGTPGVRSFDSTREYREWCAAQLRHPAANQTLIQFPIQPGTKKFGRRKVRLLE